MAAESSDGLPDRMDQGSTDEVHPTESQLRQVLDECISLYGAAHPATMAITASLVSCLTSKMKHAEALPLAQHAYTCMQRLLPPGDSELFTPMLSLATCLEKVGRLDKAECLLRQCLDLTQKTEGHEHPETIDSCTRLAMLWNTMGRHAESEALHRRAVDFQTRLLGPNHHLTIKSIMSLGHCLLSQPDKAEEGMQKLHKCVELNIRTHGMQHYDTIWSMFVLGQAHMSNTRDNAKAERLLKQGLQLGRQLLGTQDNMTLMIMRPLVICLINLGKYEEALPLCRELLELLRHIRGEEHPDTLTSKCEEVCLMASTVGDPRVDTAGGMVKFAKIERLGCRVLEACNRVLGPDHFDTKRLAECHASVSVLMALHRGKHGRR